MRSIVKHLFIVPGASMVQGNEKFIERIREEMSWEQFVHLCLNEVMTSANGDQSSLDEMASFSTWSQAQRYAYCEQYIIEAMEGLDDIQDNREDLTFFDDLTKAVESILGVAFKYIPRILGEPALAPPGMAYEIQIERTIGYDVVFAVKYLVK